jgi:hypothetical protein
VETTAPGGTTVRLLAQDSSTGGLCLDVAIGETVHQDGSCSRPSSSSAEDVRPRLLRTGGFTVVFGAVTRATTTVELTLSSGARARVRTHRGRDYRGAWAERVRFYAATLSGAPAIAAVRALDSQGRARAAADLNPLALPPVRGRAVLARLDDEQGRAAELLAVDTRVLVPTRSRRDRRVRALCVGLRSPASSAATGRAICATRPSRVEVRFTANCATGRTIIYGLAPSVIRRADVVLAGGSRRRVRVITVPGRLGHNSRALVATLQSGTAETVELSDAHGRRAATVRLAGGECN